MIKIITIGKIKETYLKEAIDDYLKRINKYHKVEIIELKESKTNDINKDLSNEATNISKYIKDKDYIIICDKEGNKLSTEELSVELNKTFNNLTNDLIFIIGSSHGIDQELKNKADYSISFSNLTFPHQLFRVILLEQLYRVFKVLNNESYHK